MRLAIAGDAAGQPLVAALKAHFAGGDVEVRDLSEPTDGDAEFYADLADRVANAVLSGDFDRAVLVCGTGIGVCISANKVPGIRAALTHDTYSAERAALSNNAQIITMGARVIGPELAKAIVEAWLPLKFDPEGRSAANVAAIDAVDARYKPG
jgi:ribose 5-phosphate isomerase B